MEVKMKTGFLEGSGVVYLESELNLHTKEDSSTAAGTAVSANLLDQLRQQNDSQSLILLRESPQPTIRAPTLAKEE